MASLLPNGKQSFETSAGTPLVGGRLYTYAAGTTTPKATYADAAETTPNTNPVILDARGEATVFWSGAYKVQLRDALDAVIWTVDGVVGSDVGFAQVASQFSQLAGSAGASTVGYLPAGASAQAATVQAKLRESVSVRDFGAEGNDATDNAVAFARARDHAALRSSAGNTTRIVFPAGRYRYSTSPNWAIIGLELEFQGEVWLINTGSGASFVLDGGATGVGVYGMKVLGFPRIYGEASSSHGVYARAIYRSKLEINIRGAGSTSSGFYSEWLVSNTLSIIMNVNEGGLYSTPARGMTLTRRAVNEESSYNLFVNPEMSGLPVGIYLDGSLGNVFHGGAVQANTLGLDTTTNAWENKFIGTDFEVNTKDARDNGRRTQFIGCDMEKGPEFGASCVGGVLMAGSVENITVLAGATDLLLSGAGYNRFGAGTITDAGTRTRYRDLRNIATSTIHNVPKARTPITVTASPFTYTNNSGNEIDVLISNGTVSQLVFTRFAGDVVSTPSGMFRLSPGDSMTATYTVAPVIVAYTR